MKLGLFSFRSTQSSFRHIRKSSRTLWTWVQWENDLWTLCKLFSFSYSTILLNQALDIEMSVITQKKLWSLNMLLQWTNVCTCWHYETIRTVGLPRKIVRLKHRSQHFKNLSSAVGILSVKYSHSRSNP